MIKHLKQGLPQQPGQGQRRGAILPLLAICTVGLMGLVALSIDIGMVAIARSQCQNAADSAAMAGARTMGGNAANNYNHAAVPVNAVSAAVANRVLNANVVGDPANITTVNPHTFTSGQVTIETGAYTYVYNDSNPAKEGFQIQFPRADSKEPYSAVRATVNVPGSYAFGRIFGLSSFNTGATAVAVHRPRDVIIVLDLSGSMRFQSLPGFYLSGSGTASPSSSGRPRTKSMNPESVYPKFGHYSDTVLAALFGATSYSTGDEMCDPCNISANANSGPPIIEDFYANGYGVAPGPGNRAFIRSPDTYESTPGGDNYLRTQNNTAGNPFAKNVNEILSGVPGKDLAFERYGYQAYVPSFSGYTEGPGYWGKTFFIWPPDPRGPDPTKDPNNPAYHANNGSKDWRQRFFFKHRASNNSLGWLDHTKLLFGSSGTPATGSNFEPGESVVRFPGTAVSVTEGGSSVSYTYRINYAAILHWLRNEPPVHFPNQLRAGRIKYYDAIPDPSDTTLNARWWSTHPLPNLNERFWRTYIDFVLGLQVTGTSGGSVTYTRRNVDPNGNALSNVPLSALIGNGDYYTWGYFKTSPKPDINPSQTGNANGTYAAGATAIATKNFGSNPAAGYYVRFGGHNTLYQITSASGGSSITLDIGLTAPVAVNETVKVYSVLPKSFNYDDNPHRPRHQLWFGPMTFVDYLGNYNTQRFWWPGNCHEAQCWACKVGIQTAIEDIKNNHPGDFIGMAFFSSPLNSNTDITGQYNRPAVPLARDYQRLKDSLWFPPSTVFNGVVEITPYDADFDLTPRAKGGTAPGMGLMIAYNMLSGSANNLRFYSQPQPQYRGHAGGLGRKGASRVVIFETDGAPNTRAYASVSGSGADSYYKIRLTNPNKYQDGVNVEWPSGGSYSDNEVYDVVKQICKLETASPPGYSTPRKPALVYPLGYGTLFDPANPSQGQSDALNFLQTCAFYGNTATNTSGSAFPDSRRIYGTNQQRIDRIRQAFTEIMQNGVQVTLIE